LKAPGFNPWAYHSTLEPIRVKNQFQSLLSDATCTAPPRPADLHKHLADDDRLFDAEAAAMEEEHEYALRVVSAAGTTGGAGFSTAVGNGPRSLAVAHINARDGTDDMVPFGVGLAELNSFVPCSLHATGFNP
jgi:hypothetical protein